MSVKANKDYLLTDGDVKKLCGKNTKILSYPELYDYDSIEDLFSDGTKKLIILYLQDKTPHSQSGHWVALIKHKNGVEFFCPYGMMPDSAIKWNKSKAKRQYLEQDEMFLTKLLEDFKKRGGDVEYNEKRMQEKDNDVSTCGRHVSMRCRFNDIPLNEYQKKLGGLRKKGINLDDAVVDATNALMGWS